MIYLDSAATTMQKPPAVARAVAQAIGSMASPGRGGHRPAARAAEVVFQCRELAGELFQVANPERVVFTSNATHSLNIAIHDLVGPGDTVLISGYEHNAVTRGLAGVGDVTIKVASGPLFAPEKMLQAFSDGLTEEVKAVLCTHVSNVFGYVLPVAEIAKLCQARRVPFIVDASQSAGCYPIALEDWGAAYIAMPGHKGLYGPQGTGLLLCGKDRIPRPLLSGGTGSNSILQQMPDFLPDRLEAGTHNTCGIAGLLEGLRYVRRRGAETILTHERMLMLHLLEGLSQVPNVTCFAGEDSSVQAGVLSLVVPGRDCEEVGTALSRRQIAVRAGLHCAPLAHRTAGTVETGTVRVSVSAFNQPWELERFMMELKRIINRPTCCGAGEKGRR